MPASRRSAAALGLLVPPSPGAGEPLILLTLRIRRSTVGSCTVRQASSTVSGAAGLSSLPHAQSQTLNMHAQVERIHALGIDPIVDYILPVWPTVNCFNPSRSDNSQVPPSDQFNSYLTAVQMKAAQFTQSGLFFTAQCAFH